MSIRPSTLPRRRSILLVALLGLLLSTAAVHAEEYAQTTCDFDPEWIINPSLADEVAYSGRTETGEPDSTFCDFYQFSWQNFLYLVSPAGDSEPKSGNAYKTQFQDTENFLPYTSKKGVNPCAGDVPEHTFFGTMPTGLEPRDWKSLDDPDIYQAGSRAVIYDRNGNPAIYSTRFSRNLCDVQNVVDNPYFPPGTTELKMAWRILDKGDDPSLYYTIEAPAGSLGAEEGKATLGLIGFHIAIVTEAHPEMIWITIEHNLNNPPCSGDDPFHNGALKSQPYSFTSRECAKDPGQCFFNEPEKFKRDQKAEMTGDPTEICQVYPYGQLPDNLDPGDNDNEANQDAIETLYRGFLEANKKPEPWSAVWSNYRMIGSLWLSQPYDAEPDQFNGSNYVAGAPCPGTAQRGSLALANTVAETDYQGPLEQSIVRNCFGCHQFTTNTTSYLRPIRRMNATFDQEIEKAPYPTRGTGTISHIFNKIFADNLAGSGVQTGFSDVRAELHDPESVAKVCLTLCRAQQEKSPVPLVWNGEFYQDGWSNRTVCNCKVAIEPVASH